MKTHYDIVYLTNSPSFYKMALCNEVARNARMLLVFYGYDSAAINVVPEEHHYNFDYVFLNRSGVDGRNRLKVFFSLCKLMHSIKADHVIFSGWSALEYNLYSFLSPRRKNVMVCESAIYVVDMDGLRGLVKRSIINRMSTVLASGESQKRIFTSIGFKGEIRITGSVGIFNKPPQSPRERRDGRDELKYLFVGRLVKEKNLELLIDAFNANGKPLTIVGCGVLEKRLKANANSNIHFTGFVPNVELDAVYRAHDVLILPSRSEAWGLVVEEALYRGLPVILSDHVGCGEDFLDKLGVGLRFNHKSVEDLQHAITRMEKYYAGYESNVSAIDFFKRDKSQVAQYLNLK